MAPPVKAMARDQLLHSQASHNRAPSFFHRLSFVPTTSPSRFALCSPFDVPEVVISGQLQQDSEHTQTHSMKRAQTHTHTGIPSTLNSEEVNEADAQTFVSAEGIHSWMQL